MSTDSMEYQQSTQYQQNLQYAPSATTGTKNTVYPNLPQFRQSQTFANLNNNTSSNYVTIVQNPARPEGGQRRKAHFNSALPASNIFVSGGLNIAWSLGLRNSSGISLSKSVRVSWFVAAVVGSILSAIVVNRIPKKFVFFFSALLVAVGGILFICVPYNYTVIYIALYLDGIGNGITFIAAFVMAGEIAQKNVRGFHATMMDATSFSFGIFLQLLFSALYTEQYITISSIQQVHGIISLICGILAGVAALTLTRESSIFHLMRNQEQEAFEVLQCQRPYVPSCEIEVLLEEHKQYISESKRCTTMENILAGLPPLFKLCLYRGMTALTYSLISSYTVSVACLASAGTLLWPFIVYGVLRWLGAFAISFGIERLGRKKPMLFAILICGGMAIGIGVLFGDTGGRNFLSRMTMAMYFMFVYQFFTGIFIASSSAYLTEAYPLIIKPCCIAITFIVEMIVQIVVVVSFVTIFSFSYYYYIVGALSFIFFIFGIFYFPETRYTTLREAQTKFQGFHFF